MRQQLGRIADHIHDWTGNAAVSEACGRRAAAKREGWIALPIAGSFELLAAS